MQFNLTACPLTFSIASSTTAVNHMGDGSGKLYYNQNKIASLHMYGIKWKLQHQ